MKSKETAATLPAALVLYEFVFFKGPTGRRIARLVPFALTAALIPLSMADFGRPLPEALDDMGKPSWTHANMSRTAYLVTQFRVVVTYLRLLVLPVNQNLDYDYPRYASLSDGAVLVSLLILVALAALAVLLLRRGGLQRLAGFGMVLFFLALAVESSIIPIADVIYEHRMYLPMAGA
ncbi:MAG: hypothetical protein GWN58_64330, partial [Anaerolineae bacterium]|nr:hypothetical protein [Anaerolineae bacterium]